MTGIKTKTSILGFDDSAVHGSKESQLNAKNVSNIFSWAQDAGMDTGIVSTARLTHATPASTYAQIVERGWECDRDLRAEDRDEIMDINKQLIYNSPGKNFKVVLGGGMTSFVPYDHLIKDPSYKDFTYETSDWNCSRIDGDDLIKKFVTKSEWLPEFKDQNGIHIDDFESLKDAIENVQDIDYVLWTFAWSHMKYDHEIDRTKDDRQPTISEMTELAIDVLEKGDNGFFLMVEGGKIDHGHHNGNAKVALSETVRITNIGHRQPHRKIPKLTRGRMSEYSLVVSYHKLYEKKRIINCVTKRHISFIKLM